MLMDAEVAIHLYTNNKRSYDFLLSEFGDKKNFKLFYRQLNEVIYEQIYLPCLFLFKNVGCFVHSGDTSSVFWRAKSKRIIILHDVAFKKDKKTYPEANSLKRKLGRLYRSISIGCSIKNVSKIITVSNFAANDIKLTYGSYLEEKIFIIPNGLTNKFELDVSSLESKKNTALLVTGSDPQKNCNFFISTLLKNNSFIDSIDHIYVAGVNDHNEIRVDFSSKISYLGHVSGNQLTELYKTSKLFFIPSLYESFGVPAIEALAAGCNVVSSSRGALPEVLGNNACFFDPMSVDSINNALSVSIGLEVKQAPEHFKALKFLERYSWESGSSQFKKVCLELFDR
jgi:glycosyltransferase involved in cell wall biosynthesis